MARPYFYHVWHHPDFDDLPAFASATLSVKKFSGTGTEFDTFYSLKKDLEELRKEGKAKGIVDDSVVSIGKSSEVWEQNDEKHQGREIWALKVGLGSDHKVLFTGNHHAREWISVEIPYLVAEYLIQNYTDSPTNEKERRIKHLLLNREIWFVPMVNPDGHFYTTKVNRNWRPNRKTYNLPAGTVSRPASKGGDVSYDAGPYTGVDLNRNYATADWGVETFDNDGFVATSRNPQDGGENSIWCGMAPSGENESGAVDSLVRREGFRASISYHSYSQLLLYPEAARSDDFVQWVGEGMRDLIKEKGNPYAYSSGNELYPTTGSLMDFSYEKDSGRPSYTPELRPPHPPPNEAHTFSGLPKEQIEPCFHENLGAALAMINSAGHDTEAAPTGWQVTLSSEAITGQVVQNSWEVFKGWAP
jgi:hypothetical protein